MNPLKDPLREELSKTIAEQVNQTFSLQFSAQDFKEDLANVPNLELGHLALPCFKISKELKSNPKMVADTLAQNWNPSTKGILAKATGPYLNFFFSPEFIGAQVLKAMNSGDYFKIARSNANPFLIEYSQPNTHKELHVGHMRNLCFGHALILLFKYCGNNVVSCTFPGDVGTHVAKCLWYLKYHNKEKVPDHNKGEWLGRMYSLAHNKLEDEKGSDLEDFNREQLTAILKQLEQKEGEFFALWKETRQWSLDLMNQVYNWAGVSFDKWYWESDVDSDSVQLVKKLHAQGLLVEDQGALGLNLEDDKLGFCMFLKSDGNGLYSTKDLELARRKFEEFNPQENIVIVDMRQELHFKQVFTAFGRLGLGDTNKCRHLKYNFVELPDGAMSSRKGNIVPITQLIDNMKSMIIKDYLSRYENEWSVEEIETTADQVAQGAIKYGMNKMDPNKKIVFDMKEWLRLDGESGPYIQYTHARICSLLKKMTDSSLDQPDWSLLSHKSETAMMVQLALFNWSMFKALEGYKSSGVCNYLYDLAKVFNTFYHDCPIGRLDDLELKKSRLALVLSTQKALATGLNLLGIPAPERM